jgi:hypothetical protein
MMPNAHQTNSLPALKAWARQHCRNAVQDAIRDTEHPLSWDGCDQVEELVMTEFEGMIAHLTVDRLRNRRYMNSLIDQIVADTVGLLKRSRMQGE